MAMYSFISSWPFLLSSKAGGCGINLIGGNRLVLFDPDWNPSSDKQAAGRIWREGQKKRCYIYRFMSTGSIEEKIIQRQLFKQSLQDIVDDRDAVNNIPQNELKNLFVREIDTRSDTHDTLSCTRCKSVKTKDKSKSCKTLNAQQIEECQHFLNDFMEYTKETLKKMEASASIPAGEHTVSTTDLRALLSGLSNNEFQTLPQFSKKLRNLIWSMQQEIEEIFAVLNNTTSPPVDADGCQQHSGVINIYEEFLNRWDDCVKMLTTTGRCTYKSDGKGIADETEAQDTAEFVPQEGCPEDEDFNRWSHHSTVDTCDDEALRRACQDNDVVSFVFGLEVNWSLLQSKQEEQKEEEEKKKKKAKDDLDALNKRRQMEKENAANLELLKQQKMEQKMMKGMEVDGDQQEGQESTPDDGKEIVGIENMVSNGYKDMRGLMKEEKKKRSSGMNDSLAGIRDSSVKMIAVAENDGKKSMHIIRDGSRDSDDDDDFVQVSNNQKKDQNRGNVNVTRRVIDDEDDDDDGEIDDFDRRKVTILEKERPFTGPADRSAPPSGVLGTSKKGKKLTPGKEREIQTEKDFKQLLVRLQLFDSLYVDNNCELIDAFEALLMCIGNFASFEWVRWDEKSISDLSTLADQLVNMLETFPGMKPEKKLLLRPAFQSGSFATSRINRFKDFSAQDSVNIINNLSTIYKEIGRDNLPRAISGALKSCGYKHRNLLLTSLPHVDSQDSDVDARLVATNAINNYVNDNCHSGSQISVASSSGWNCHHCTYYHEVDCMVCEMCGVKRPRRKRDTSSQLSEDPGLNNVENSSRPSKPKRPKNVIQ